MMNMKDSKELYEKYGEDYLKFNEAHEKEQIKRQEIVQLEDHYKIISEKEKGLNIEQQEIMQVSEMNLPNEERKIKEDVQEQFNETQKEYECAVKNITEKRNNRKTANQEFRSRGIAKFKEEGCILSKQSLSNLSTRGTTLSEYNMKQSQKGERPGVYEICYIVFENERCSGFKEHVSSLMKNGWDYGFIPVFICEKEIFFSVLNPGGKESR